MIDKAKKAYWKKHIDEWRASGLTRGAYCQREGLKPTTFDYWCPRIAPNRAEVAAVKPPVVGERVTLVPVKVIEPPVDHAREITVLKSPSGWEVQLPAQADPNWLIKVLRQLP